MDDLYVEKERREETFYKPNTIRYNESNSHIITSYLWSLSLSLSLSIYLFIYLVDLLQLWYSWILYYNCEKSTRERERKKEKERERKRDIDKIGIVGLLVRALAPLPIRWNRRFGIAMLDLTFLQHGSLK